MRTFPASGPRSEGQALWWFGRDSGSTLVVLDPAGSAKHGDLPPTWQRLADRFRIAWFRVPAGDGTGHEADEVLRALAAHDTDVRLIASGDAAVLALQLADRYPRVVREVMLIDPVTAPRPADVSVRVVARSQGGPADRVEEPLPLGHPEVARAVGDSIDAGSD